MNDVHSSVWFEIVFALVKHLYYTGGFTFQFQNCTTAAIQIKGTARSINH